MKEYIIEEPYASEMIRRLFDNKEDSPKKEFKYKAIWKDE